MLLQAGCKPRRCQGAFEQSGIIGVLVQDQELDWMILWVLAAQDIP